MHNGNNSHGAQYHLQCRGIDPEGNPTERLTYCTLIHIHSRAEPEYGYKGNKGCTQTKARSSGNSQKTR